MNMKLVIDIGNSFVKYAVFDGSQMIEINKSPEVSKQSLLKLLDKYKAVDAAIVSSVRKNRDDFEVFLNNKLHVLELNWKTPIPFTNLYKTPETVGKDRLAAVAGAQSLFPDQNILVIDTGTCITYDLLTTNNEYHGGSISLGLQMRFNALHTLTNKLPLVEADYEKKIALIGDSTQTSILSGVQNGVLQEVDGIIEQYKVRFAELKIVLCGGDNKYFDKYLKNNIFAAPNLVLHGLNKILQFNENI